MNEIIWIPVGVLIGVITFLCCLIAIKTVLKMLK